ncbi:MAG: M14 family zinc carboxypeptidase [bacterium]
MFIYFLSLVLGINIPNTYQPKTESPKMLVRVYNTTISELQQYDVAGCEFGKWVDIIVSQEELNTLGKGSSIILPDYGKYLESVKADYPSYSEFTTKMNTIASTYPSIAKLYVIGKTVEGKDVLALKISDNVNTDEDEPTFLVMGNQHADEWPGLLIPLTFADTLTKKYGSDTHIANLINSREFWIIPCSNPDGYAYSHDGGNSTWRKDRQTPAMDPNRNWNGACNGEIAGEWGGRAVFGTTQITFCGYAPFQDSGVKHISNLLKTIDVNILVSYHTYSRTVLWPWGYKSDATPDGALMSTVGGQLASTIGSYSGQQIYTYVGAGVTGGSDDWQYGHALEVEGENMLVYSVEACNTANPTGSILLNEVSNNLKGLFFLADTANYVKNTLTTKIKAPEIQAIDSVPTNFTIKWEKRLADKYELQEYKTLTLNTDDAESDRGWWTLEGFALATTQKHSGSKSYFSGRSNGAITAMTSNYPLPKADSITFWIWVYHENNVDWCWFEVSKDGKEWAMRDSFTGTHNTWNRKSYPFPSGYKSLYIRFRNAYDAGTAQLGVYIDDIYPVPTFGTISSISSTITDTSYYITSKPYGKYWYNVRGNNSRGWGNWGQLEEVDVGNVGIAHSQAPEQEFVLKCNSITSTSSVNIEYALPSNCKTKLNIYDITGKVVKTILDKEQNKGLNKVTLDTKSFVSGVYFISLETPIFSKKTKLILIK